MINLEKALAWISNHNMVEFNEDETATYYLHLRNGEPVADAANADTTVTETISITEWADDDSPVRFYKEFENTDNPEFRRVVEALVRKGKSEMKNTIILLHGSGIYTYREYKRFKKGDTLWGIDCNPEEIKRWSIDQAEEAKAELAKYRSSYKHSGQLWHVEEYALEYCNTNDEGEFMWGSDYDPAEEEGE